VKTIYLVRHAKSSWDMLDVKDRDRPLKERGVHDAYLVSNHLTKEVQKVQSIFSSPANRAVHTALIFSKNLEIPFSKISIHEELYLSSMSQILSFIGTLDSDLDTIMVFFHNPTITQFINEMTDTEIQNVPTSGIGCLKFYSQNWDLPLGQGELISFDYPKKWK